MANKDFRSRLKEHETPVNPVAWSQMEELLDTLPAVEKKQNYRWVLLLALLFIVIGTGLYFWANNKTDQSTLSQRSQETNLSIDKQNKLETTKAIETTQTKPDIKTNRTTTETKTVSSSNNEQHIVTSVNPTYDKTKDTVNQLNSQTNNSSNIAIASSVAKTNTSLKTEKKGSKIAATKESISQTATTTKSGNNKNNNSVKSLLDDTQPKPSVNQKSIEDYTKSLLAEMILMNMLSTTNLESNSTSSIELPKQTQIELLKNRPMYWTGGVGLADINSNRGYYVGAGLYYELDKILGVEPNLSMSSTSRIPGQSNSFSENDLEINLTLWIHLNLWRTANHKLTLELAPALNANWFEQEPNTGFEFAGISPNYKAGLSYTYLCDKGYGIGVKGAFSLYDSGFVAFQFLKKF